MIAATVAPAGVRSIARILACLVSGRVVVFGDECADRERGFDLLVVRAAERVEALDFDLDFVMGSSHGVRRPSAAPPQPRPGKTPAGQDPKAVSTAASSHSNAPIKPESQSILSKIVAHFPQSVIPEMPANGGLLRICGRSPDSNLANSREKSPTVSGGYLKYSRF